MGHTAPRWLSSGTLVCFRRWEVLRIRCERRDICKLCVAGTGLGTRGPVAQVLAVSLCHVQRSGFFEASRSEFRTHLCRLPPVRSSPASSFPPAKWSPWHVPPTGPWRYTDAVTGASSAPGTGERSGNGDVRVFVGSPASPRPPSFSSILNAPHKSSGSFYFNKIVSPRV